MDESTFGEIKDAIMNRSTWESRMDTMYRARFTGIGRSQKPYPNAPDMRYPLIDTDIEKMRPFYGQQIYSDLVLATFVGDNSLAREQIVNAEQWFDYQLKQKSDFESAIMKGADYMLNYGFCPVKIYWDVEKKHVCFDPTDPLYVIVPQNTDDDPDWIIHVMPMSVAQYKRNKNYKLPADEIKGKGQASNISVGVQKEQSKYDREGLTYSANDNQIILWEVYTREGDKWSVETIAPVKGWEGSTVREAYGLPPGYEGHPFVQLRYDNSQKGWYSSRGLAEILVLHQQALNKNWNAQLQFLDFFGHPQYENTGLTPINPGNFQSAPGRILPPGVKPVPSPSAPMDFQNQMQFVRALAEDRIAVPDFGTAENLSGPNMKGGKTATAVNAIVGITNQSNDARSKAFRLQLGKIYNKAWSLLKENAKDQLSYIFDSGNGQNMGQLDPMMFNYQYNIVPSGSADSWNKQQRVQQSLQMLQLLKNDPNIDQLELDKWALEATDPRLVTRLIKDSGMQSMKQAEKQSVETAVMLNGRPMTTNPSDDDMAHVQDGMGFMQRRLQTGEPLTPEFTNNMFTHLNDHANQMKSKKHPMANQVAKGLAQSAKVFQQAMAIHQQMGGGQPPQGQPQAPQGPQQPQEQPDPIDPRPGWTPVDYKAAPPSIQRQIEQKEGFQPATDQESMLSVLKDMPKPPAPKVVAPPKQPIRP